MRALLVVNPNARRGSGVEARVRAALTARGVEVVASGRPSGVPRPIDAIVVAGGDGTIAGVVPQALAFNVPVGVVPLGTFNELARTLDIPPSIDAAAAAIAAGRTRSIDVAQVNGVAYLSEASIGISSRIAALQTPREKRRYGIWAIVASVFHAFAHARPIHVCVRFDDVEHCFKTIQLTVANSHRFGGVVHVDDAAIDDGWLDLYSVEIANPLEAVGVAHALRLGRRSGVPGLRAYRAHAFQIETHRPHHITADGEPAGMTPARFTLLPKALRVFVPE